MEKREPPLRIVMPGQGVSQRGHQRPRPLHLPPNRGPVHRPRRELCRPQADPPWPLPSSSSGRGTRNPACARVTSPSPSPARRWMSTGGWRPRWTSASPRARVGSKSWAAGWSTRPCWKPRASTPTEYSGFAFGMGIERIAMLKWQIGDLRAFFENDVRLLEAVHIVLLIVRRTVLGFPPRGGHCLREGSSKKEAKESSFPVHALVDSLRDSFRFPDRFFC